jgi:hypothetical protein
LESVLEEVRNRFGDTVAIVEANRLRKGGVGGFFARERFEVVVDVDEDGHSSAEPTEIPAEFGLEATEDFCERLLTMADAVSDGDRDEASGPSATSVSTEQPGFAAVLDSITRHMDSPTAADAAAPLVDARALARLGLPEDIRRAALVHPAPPAGTDPSPWLLGLLSDLPAAGRLPQGPGSVIVVAGGREAALHLARQIAAELGLDPDALLIASAGYKGRAIPTDRRLTSVEAAGESRLGWRRRPRPTVVAVDAPLGRSSEWARRVIDALEPTMVWGAVDAARKPEDIFEWAEQLGGFDAVGLTDLDATVSPAAVLQCGIPIGRLDGRPATPALWAALLAPRLVG